MKLFSIIMLVIMTGCNLLKDSKEVVENPIDMSSDFESIDASCFDSVKNGTETDFNCGGECRPCTDNLTCLVNEDCTSKICNERICTPPQCDDGVGNGTESDIDCGGICDPCENGATCRVLKDCASNICKDTKCVDSCETTCGGACRKCEEGETCASDDDCLAGLKCEGSCVPEDPVFGWERVVSFRAEASSVHFNPYVRVPDFTDEELNIISFEQNGVDLAFEPAEEPGAFWVNLKDVKEGENSFRIIADERKISDVQMWTDHVAVFHSPGIRPIIAENITLQAAVGVQSTPGRFGNASQFDGAAYVLVNGDGVDALSSTYSISAWVKPDIISNDWKPIYGRQFGANSKDDFAMGHFLEGRLYPCAFDMCFRAQGPDPLDEWTFVTVTYDGTMKLYINGELDNQTVVGRPTSTAGNPISIGGDIDNAQGVVDRFYIGSIDEIRFSSHVKSAAAIQLQFLSADPTFFQIGEKQPLED